MPVGDQSERKLTRATGVLWRTTLRGVLLNIPDREEPLLCTKPGDALWALLARPHTGAELAAELAERFSTTPEQVRADIEPVVTHLLGLGVITASPSAQ